MYSAQSSGRLIRDRFAPLSGLPCWDVRQGYGSFVTMNFGQPHLDVTEPAPKAKSRALRRRRVTVSGEHHLWIEQCEWRIIEFEKEIAMSESDATDISRALARLDSQLLKEITIEPARGTCCFKFEYDMAFNMCRHAEFEPADPIWHLYSPGSVISYIASGRIEYGSGTETRPQSMICDEIRLAI